MSMDVFRVLGLNDAFGVVLVGPKGYIGILGGNSKFFFTFPKGFLRFP